MKYTWFWGHESPLLLAQGPVQSLVGPDECFLNKWINKRTNCEVAFDQWPRKQHVSGWAAEYLEDLCPWEENHYHFGFGWERWWCSCLEDASIDRMQVMWAQHRGWGQKPASETEGRGPGSRVGSVGSILKARRRRHTFFFFFSSQDVMWMQVSKSIYLFILGFPGGSVVKNLPANAGDSSSIPESGRSPGEGHGNPLQHSCLGNPMDRGAQWGTVHGVSKSRTHRSDWTCMHLSIYVFIHLPFIYLCILLSIWERDA